ncbi:hypothetical protein OMF40_14420, partial [Bordetella pertussis]
MRGGMVEVLVVAISMSMRSAAMKRTLMELRHSAAIHARAGRRKTGRKPGISSYCCAARGPHAKVSTKASALRAGVAATMTVSL